LAKKFCRRPVALPRLGCQSSAHGRQLDPTRRGATALELGRVCRDRGGGVDCPELFRFFDHGPLSRAGPARRPPLGPGASNAPSAADANRLRRAVGWWWESLWAQQLRCRSDRERAACRAELALRPRAARCRVGAARSELGTPCPAQSHPADSKRRGLPGDDQPARGDDFVQLSDQDRVEIDFPLGCFPIGAFEHRL
jgi:hypothetical protein